LIDLIKHGTVVIVASKKAAEATRPKWQETAS